MSKDKKQRRRVLCKVKAYEEIYTIYEDGSWRTSFWDKGEYGTWDVAVGVRTNKPCFLYSLEENSDKFISDGDQDEFIAKAILEAQSSLAMESILKGD